jgi:hypothetical protein
MTEMMFMEDIDMPPMDSVPPTIEVEHPCDQCGRETGWTGRGRRKKLCDNCRPTRKSSGPNVRVTGKTSDLAAQAAKTLSSINSVMAMGVGAFGFFHSMSAMMDKNEDFEKAAYAALVTDPGLCQQILTVGQTSAKISLALAYLSYGMGIAPTVAQEYAVKKAARLAQMDAV